MRVVIVPLRSEGLSTVFANGPSGWCVMSSSHSGEDRERPSVLLTRTARIPSMRTIPPDPATRRSSEHHTACRSASDPGETPEPHASDARPWPG
jgi:hypothetical protein